MKGVTHKVIDVLLNWKTFSAMLSLLLVTNSLAYGYELSNHEYITGKAITNYKEWVLCDEVHRVGYQAIDFYDDDLIWGSVHEDDFTNWVEHFWNPDGGANAGIYLYDSAYTRATEYFELVKEYYADGEYENAYRTLGRILHLIEDMGVPAHTNLDPHIQFLGDPDWYENAYILTNYPTNETCKENQDSLYDLMYNLAETSDDFDSDDYDGETEAVDRSDGFNDTEGAIIANACFKGAVRAVGGFMEEFYSTISPVATHYKPYGGVYSGVKGVPLDVGGDSYGPDDFIEKAEFRYNHNDDMSGGWLYITTVYSRNELNHFESNWYNSINDKKVWVRSEVADNGLCESSSELSQISIDSTRPRVTNLRK